MSLRKTRAGQAQNPQDSTASSGRETVTPSLAQLKRKTKAQLVKMYCAELERKYGPPSIVQKVLMANYIHLDKNTLISYVLAEFGVPKPAKAGPAEPDDDDISNEAAGPADAEADKTKAFLECQCGENLCQNCSDYVKEFEDINIAAAKGNPYQEAGPADAEAGGPASIEMALEQGWIRIGVNAFEGWYDDCDCVKCVTQRHIYNNYIKRKATAPPAAGPECRVNLTFEPSMATEALITDLARLHPEMEFGEICRAVKRAAAAAEASFAAGPAPEDADEEVLRCDVCGIKAFENEAMNNEWLIDDEGSEPIILCPPCQIDEECHVCSGKGNLLKLVGHLWVCPNCVEVKCVFCKQTTQSATQRWEVSGEHIVCPTCAEQSRKAYQHIIEGRVQPVLWSNEPC